MAFVCLLLYLVVTYLRPAEWMRIFQGWQLLDITTIATAFFLAFDLAISRRGFARVPHNRMMLGLTAAIVCSHLANTYLWGAWASLVGFFPLLVMYFLVVNTVTTERRLQVMLWALVLLTVLLAVQGIQQSKTGVGWAGQEWFVDELNGQHRITWIGIFDDPNDLALAFVSVLPLLLAALFRRSFILFKLAPVYLLSILLYGIYLTNSRGGLLAAMAAVAFFFIKCSRWRVAGGIVGGAFATLLFLFGPSRLGALSAQEDSAYGRLDAWYYGFQLLKRSPLFGVGQMMFTEDYPLTAHNSFLLALSELGIVGFFFWVGLLYTAFKGLSLVQQRTPRLAPYAYGLQAALVGFSAGALFLSRTYVMLPYLLVALSAAVLNVAKRHTPDLDFRFTKRDVRNVLFLCLAIVLLLQAAMKTWL